MTTRAEQPGAVVPRRADGAVGQDAVQEPSTGAALLPFFMTVKPKLVDAPAARLPLPFGRIVMTLPELSQVGVPFQVEEILCGGVIVTVVVQLVIGELPAVTVTLPLKRSLHSSCLLYVTEQEAVPPPPPPDPEPPSAVSTAV